MAKGFKQAGNVGKNNEEKKTIIFNEKESATIPKTPPSVTSSSYLKFGNGLKSASSMPRNYEKNLDMHDGINNASKSKVLKSTFGQTPRPNTMSKDTKIKSNFGQVSSYIDDTAPQGNGFKSTFKKNSNSDMIHEPTMEYYDEALPKNNRRKKLGKKKIIALIAAVAAVFILAFGLLNVPYFKPTWYIFMKAYNAASNIQSMNVTGDARLVDEFDNDYSFDYELNYNNNAFSFGIIDGDDYDWCYGNIDNGQITLWDEYSEEDKYTLPFKFNSSYVKNIKKSLKNIKKEYTQVNGAPIYKFTGELTSSEGMVVATPVQFTISINAKTYLPEYIVGDATDIANAIYSTVDGTGIKECSFTATFINFGGNVNVNSSSSNQSNINLNTNSISSNTTNTKTESTSDVTSKVAPSKVTQGEYKWYVSNDKTQECVGKCVIFNVTGNSFDAQVSHARSQGIGYYPKTANLQKDGTYVADGDISGRNVKTNESDYTPVKFVFTVLDNDRIKMDVYEAKTNKEIETNVIFYLYIKREE